MLSTQSGSAPLGTPQCTSTLTFEGRAPAEAEVTKGFGRGLKGPGTLGGDPKLGRNNARLGFARHVIPPKSGSPKRATRKPTELSKQGDF